MHENDFDKVKKLIEKKKEWEAILEICLEKDYDYSSFTISEVNGKSIDPKRGSILLVDPDLFEAFHKYAKNVLRETIEALHKLGVEVKEGQRGE